MATVTVALGTSYQTFKGWEAKAEIASFGYHIRYTNWQAAALDAGIDLGITRLRTEIQSGTTENSTDHSGLFLDSGLEFVNNTDPVQYANYRANRRIPVNDNGDPNVINVSGFKWRYLDQQINTVIAPMRTRAAARGESIFWTICYVHFSTANQLHVDSPAEYGELMLATWQHAQDTFGYVPNGLEIFLEPDASTAQVTAAEIAAMIIAAVDRLVAAGFSKPYIIAPSNIDGTQTEAYYAAIKAANATAASYIDEISYHRYISSMSTGQVASLRTAALADGKNTAMSEFIGADVDVLYDDLTFGRVSSWQQFTLCFSVLGNADPANFPITDNGAQLFLAGTGPGYAVTMGVRTKYLRSYMKYIRPGAVMKGCTNESSSYVGVAFQNANGTAVVVVKCDGTQILTIVGLPAGTYEIRYTTGFVTTEPTAYDIALPNQTITGGQNVVFTIPDRGVVAIFDTNYMSPVSTGASGLFVAAG